MCDDETDLMEACPRCEYSLRTLPIAHQCPECGLAFDRRWRIVAGRTCVNRVQRSTGARKVLIFLLIHSGVILLLLWAFLPAGRSGLSLMILLMLVALGAAIAATYRKPRTFVAIGPAGLVVYYKHTLHAYPNVRRARYAVLHKRVEVETESEVVHLPEWRFFPALYDQAEACAREINHYLAAHPPEPDASTESARATVR